MWNPFTQAWFDISAGVTLVNKLSKGSKAISNLFWKSGKTDS